MSTIVTGTVAAEGGAQIYYESRGTADTALLVIGGIGSGAIAGTEVAGLLAEDFRLISYDRRATLRSGGRTDRDLDVVQQAGDVVQVLKACGVTAAVMFAPCGGASIGLELLTRYPEHVTALIVHEPIVMGVLPDASQQLAFYRGLCALSQREGPVRAASTFLESHGLPFAESFQDLMRREGDYFIGHELMPMVEYTPDLTALADGEPPLVMAVGAESLEQYAYVRTAWHLAAALGREAEILPGHHTGYFQQPEAVSAALAALVRRTLARPSPARI